MNWYVAYNKLFEILNTGESYHSGPMFLSVLKQINPDTLSYQQLIKQRNDEKKSTSRKDYYQDLIFELDEQSRMKLFRLFIEITKDHSPEKVKKLEEYLDDMPTGPIAAIPKNVWNSDRLTKYLEEMDKSINDKKFNYTLTLAYTCLEGFYKSFIRRCIPDKADIKDLNPMAKIVREYVKTYHSEKKIEYPEQILNLITTITNAISNSRNSFSESHFNEVAQEWLAEFVRDCVNTIVRLLLKFV